MATPKKVPVVDALQPLPKLEKLPEVEVVLDKRPVEVTYDGHKHVVHTLTGSEFDHGDTVKMLAHEALDLQARSREPFTVREA